MLDAKIKKLKQNLFYSVVEITDKIEVDLVDFPELERIRHQARQRESYAVRLALKALISKLGLPFLGLNYNERRKPFLKGSNAGISLTHGHGLAIAVWLEGAAVGADFEKISPKLLRVAKRFCNEEELAYCGEDLDKLAVLWTVKEAVYKWYGLGGVDFQQHIHVPPFELVATGGDLLAELNYKSFSIPLQVHYMPIGEGMFSICYQQK
ncbi:4'-phosphopantetheinyl transferase family protein [Persicobacter psychrovividus]|uniref:4'-phosphopantetheinyl transferase superfamily protein n=1 Tax=Persicobacter psychrovividus TaxID=387638 RepID=A0ABM7VBR0_9BACT|nr:hypothetical protein PEPS_06480 [Persicobacter psychrovividus]